MKKFISLLTLIVTICVTLFSCQNDEDYTVPVEQTYPNADQLLTEFREELLAADNGWEAVLAPKLGKIYHLYLKPASDGTIKVYADVDTEAVEASASTTYTLQVKQGTNPTISFDPGSNLDKIPGVGKNISIDKEYTFKSRGNDTLYLEGNQYGDVLKLKRATTSTAQLFEGGRIKQTMNSLLNYLPAVRVFYFEPSPGTKIQFVLRSSLRSTYFIHVENNAAHSFGSDFIYIENGVKLRTPTTIHGVFINEILWDEDEDKLYVIHNGSKLYANTSYFPVIPLHYLMGNEFSSGIVVMIPPATGQPIGWSYKFERDWTLTDYDVYVKGGSIGVSYLGLLIWTLELDMEGKKMTMTCYNIDVRNQLYVAKFPFSFTKTNDGVFDFTALPLELDTPEGQYANVFKDPFKRLTDLISNHRFKINFYNYPGGPYMPEYQSMEDTEMYFVGDFIE